MELFRPYLILILIMGFLSGCVVRESRYDSYSRYKYHRNRHANCYRCGPQWRPGEPQPHHVHLHPGNPPSMTIFPPNGGRYTIIMSEEDLYRLEENLIEWRKHNGTLVGENPEREDNDNIQEKRETGNQD